MPVVLADVAAQSMGGAWPLVAPWIGALGAFIAGSATFSNMLLASIQHGVAVARGLDAVTILALQCMGAAGNMICIHNVVVAGAVVGLKEGEGEVIRRTAPVMALHLLLAGVVGWLS